MSSSSSSSFYDKALTGAERFSLTHKMSHQLATWDCQQSAGVIKRISVRFLGVITLPFLGLIDTVAHAAMFVGKLGLGVCLLPANMVITLINRKSVHPDLTLTSAFLHFNVFAQSTVHTLILWVVVFFSPTKAAAISGKLSGDSEKSKKIIVNLTKEVEEAKIANEGLNNKVASKDSELKNLNVRVKTLNDANSNLQADQIASKATVRNLEVDKLQLQNRVNNDAILNGNLSAQVSQLNAQNTDQQKVIAIKDADIKKFIIDVGVLNDQINSLKNDLKAKKPDLDRLRNENVSIRSLLSQLQHDFNAKVIEIQKSEQTNHALNLVVSQLQANLNVKQGEITNLSDQVSRLTSQNGSQQSELVANALEINNLRGDVTTLKGQASQLVQDLSSRDAEVAGLKPQVSALDALAKNQQSELVASALEIDSLKGKIVTLEGQVSQLRDNLSSRDAEVVHLKTQESILIQLTEDQRSELVGRTADIKALSGKILVSDAQIASLTAENDSYLKLNENLEKLNADLSIKVNEGRTSPTASPSGSSRPITPPPLPRDPEIVRSIEKLTLAYEALNPDPTSDLHGLPVLTEAQTEEFNAEYRRIKDELKNPGITTKRLFAAKKHVLEECLEYLANKSVDGFDPTQIRDSAGPSITELPEFDSIASEMMMKIADAKDDFERQKPLMENFAKYLNLWYEKLDEQQKEMGAKKQQVVKEGQQTEAERQAAWQAKKDQELKEWRASLKQAIDNFGFNTDTLNRVGKTKLFEYVKTNSTHYPLLFRDFDVKDLDGTLTRIKNFMENIMSAVPYIKDTKETAYVRYTELRKFLTSVTPMLERFKIKS